MKVSTTVRNAWSALSEAYEPLALRVDELMNGRVRQPRWHYESRLKSLESYALKVETGRYPKMLIDDFFACTIVVENRKSVATAESLVGESFEILARRPKKDGETHKRASEFVFDDLRLYVAWRDEAARPSGFAGMQFEVQIKTFLQHAWSIATHDLVYKGSDVNWSLERIAFAVKAMLEHAEASIDGASRLADLEMLSRSDRDTSRLRDVLGVLSRQWPADRLPHDKVRLAQNVNELLNAAGIGLGDLDRALTDETSEGRGILTESLSPYGIVVTALARRHSRSILGYLGTKPHRKSFRVFVVPEMQDTEVSTLTGPLIVFGTDKLK